MRTKNVSMRRLVMALAVAVGLSSLAGCATAPTEVTTTTSSTSVSSPASTTASAETLLDKVSTTILGQPVVYPTALPAQVSSSIVTLPPGVETGLHRHDAPMYAYILEGDLTVTYESGEVKEYHPGDALIEAVDTPHNGRNNGTVPVRVLVVNMGAEGVANTVKL